MAFQVSRMPSCQLLPGSNLLSSASCGATFAESPSAAEGRAPSGCIDNWLSALGSQLRVAVSATPAAGTAPLTVAFNGSVTGASTVEYNWSFGDGAHGASESHVNHTYTTAGYYLVTLTVSNGTSVASNETAVIVNGLVSTHWTPTQLVLVVALAVVAALIVAFIVDWLWRARRPPIPRALVARNLSEDLPASRPGNRP